LVGRIGGEIGKPMKQASTRLIATVALAVAALVAALAGAASATSESCQ
jgi:hypothetical protein